MGSGWFAEFRYVTAFVSYAGGRNTLGLAAMGERDGVGTLKDIWLCSRNKPHGIEEPNTHPAVRAQRGRNHLGSCLCHCPAR
jgi:hypothetical protein